MSLTTATKKEVLQVYNTWLHSYLNGDVATYNSYLDTAFHFIGSTGNEEFLNRNDTTDFFKATAAQFAGKSDLRNETKIVEQFGEVVIITHLFDAWFLAGDDWSFYGRFRFTNALQKKVEGWRFIYQHYSTPDSKAQEGETIGYEQVSAENLKLREAIQRRTVELESKNRELEVEGALARIRAEAVAMKQSIDLLEIVVTMRTEFIKLGHEAHYFWHMMWLPSTYVKAMTSGDGTKIGFVMELPRHIHGDIPMLANWEKSKKPIVVYAMDTDAALDYVDKMVTLGDFQNIDPQAPTEDNIRHIGGLTFIMARTTHGEIGYSLPGVVNNPPKEDLDILEKFAGAFDLAHRRFLDLKKAERQAREIQIELALEKVRSRSMGMQDSEELKEVIQVVFNQFIHLNIHVEHTGFIIDYKVNNDMHIWLADQLEVPSRVTVPYFDTPNWNSFNEAKEKGNDFFMSHYTFKEKNKFYKKLFQLIPGIPKDAQDYYFKCPGLDISGVLLENVGLYIERFSSIPYSEEENKILIRFGKVFQQTYTRFLDLQKAEAQAHEAKIEASLERVRTVALTLTKSDDMLEVAQALYEQLLALGFTDIRNAIIDIHNDATETFLDYDYSHDMSSAVTEFSYYGDPVIEQQIKKTQSGHDAFFEIELKGDELKELIATRLKNGEKDDPRLHTIDHLTYNLYSFGNGAIGISNFGILNEDQKKTLKRFRNVFTFAYKRYTDLARAEAQALEAKIEAALERVRSVALGLNTSEDMLEVAQALYEQLLGLGFANIRNSIIDIDNDDGLTFSDYDYSNEMGGTVTQMSYKDDPTLKEQLEDIIATTDGFSEMVLEGQQLQDLIAMRRNNGEADDPRLRTTESLSYILYAFGKGAIGISNFGVLTEHQKAILSRFRNVFTFAYQRYTGLAKSEAQAAALLAEKQRLEVTLADLQATQKQLIQSEKMASLGELTAGIAHEIQNPLNFVNNFSEVSNELIDEMNEEIEKGDLEEAKLIANDIKQNLEKINHHGKRADAIVKGMLQHSRKSSAKKEPTDLNKLADEYLRLAYHGLRAKDKNFNATLETDFDASIGLVNVIPQDLGRVILNLITNAFYAVNERKNASEDSTFKPTVSISTKQYNSPLSGRGAGGEGITISVKDNGKGIPKHVIDKIFQPFFTTKPTGEGTGLGLSMSYDIVTKGHGGELKVESVDYEGTNFIVQLPTKA